MKHIVDMHSHILPQIDDGSNSPEMSVEMLKRQAEQGICQVVATPHFYPWQDYPEQFLLRRQEAETRLREEIKKHANLPQVHMGAEVHYFPGMSHSELLPELTIDSGKHILIEMPNDLWTDTMYRELVRIREYCDLIPVLAHIDRYLRTFRTQSILEKLEDLPILVQANASFFLNSGTRRLAMKMLRKEQIHLLGSDCHNLTSRGPNLGDAVSLVERRLGENVLIPIGMYQDAVFRKDENFSAFPRESRIDES